MSQWAAVILAAGEGKRMKSHLPKVLHPLAGKPILQHIVQTIRDTGIDHTVVVVGKHDQLIQQVIGDEVTYCKQEEPLGTGHALAQTHTAVGSSPNILVINGDTPLVTSATLKRLMQAHVDSQAVLSMLTAHLPDAGDLGRVQRDREGRITGVVEAIDADAAEASWQETNVGVYCFRGDWLWRNLYTLHRQPNGEYYLTDLVAAAASEGQNVCGMVLSDAAEAVSINSRVHLAQAEAIQRQRIRLRLLESGVTMIDPATTYIDADVFIARDTIIYPNTFVLGKSRIGAGCSIGPNSIIIDSEIGNDCRIVASMVEGSILESMVDVGPYSHLRPGAYLAQEVHIGNFAEVKKARLGRGVKMGHFSYIGDAQIGDHVNIGAGTITCNFDGVDKHETIIGEGAFIGSDTMLVAPVKVGDGAKTGAGSVVTRDIPACALAVGVPARVRSKRKKKEESVSSGMP